MYIPKCNKIPAKYFWFFRWSTIEVEQEEVLAAIADLNVRGEDTKFLYYLSNRCHSYIKHLIKSQIIREKVSWKL